VATFSAYSLGFFFLPSAMRFESDVSWIVYWTSSCLPGLMDDGLSGDLGSLAVFLRPDFVLGRAWRCVVSGVVPLYSSFFFAIAVILDAGFHAPARSACCLPFPSFMPSWTCATCSQIFLRKRHLKGTSILSPSATEVDRLGRARVVQVGSLFLDPLPRHSLLLPLLLLIFEGSPFSDGLYVVCTFSLPSLLFLSSFLRLVLRSPLTLAKDMFSESGGPFFFP